MPVNLFFLTDKVGDASPRPTPIDARVCEWLGVGVGCTRMAGVYG